MSGGLAVVGLAFVGLTMTTGLVLAITFFGLAVLALSIRSARGVGNWSRALARSMLGVKIDDPEPFVSRPGFLGWLQSSLRDRVGWRAVGYLAVKVPWTALGFYVAFSLWWDAFACLAHPLLSHGGDVPVFGLVRTLFPQGYFSVTNAGFLHEIGIVVSGALFLAAAPWVMRGFVNVDRMLIGALLGPDPLAARVHRLEQARTQTVDASAATLRRIERDLHDGTQAQLVALAMRLGMAKEKLAAPATMSTSTGCANWSTKPTAAPRKPSPNCVTSPGGSIHRRSTSAWKGPWPRWRRVVPCRRSSPSTW